MDRFLELDARDAGLDWINLCKKTHDAHFTLKALDRRVTAVPRLKLGRESAKTREPLQPYTNVSPIPMSNGARSCPVA